MSQAPPLAPPVGASQPAGVPQALAVVATSNMLTPFLAQPAAPLHGHVLHPVVATSNYGFGLAAGLGRVQRAWASSTLDSRARVQRAFSGWLASLPPSFGKSWYTVDPYDIICFCETGWLPYHAGTPLPEGKGQIVAPSSLNGVISHLSTSMRLIGRSADWDSFGRMCPLLSNPACCGLLRSYKRGYAKDAKALGYEPCSAYPLSEATYQQLLDGLRQRAAEQTAANDPVGAAITWRDGCGISALWETALRGHDGGILRCNSIRGLDGRPVLPFQAPPLVGTYLVYPWSTKVQQVGPCQPIQVQHPSDPAQQRYSFISWLWELQQASTRLQQPLYDFLLRPTDGPTFLERPLGSAAIHERFVYHLRRLGLYEGQSTHGIRRGTLQNEALAGAAFESIQQRAQIKTDRIVRLYLDPAAHLRGGKGHKRLREAGASSGSDDSDAEC